MPEHTSDTASPQSWKPAVVYGMAAACLVLGLAVGYLLRGSESQASVSMTAKAVAVANPNPSQQMPTLDQMKQMADKKVAPLLEQLQKDPKNKDLLLRVAYFYRSAHQFKQAGSYFKQALELDPKNVALRTEMASCLYYDGDVDGAVAQLEQSVKLSPKDANSLFNLGMIRWKGKKDAPGAIQAWQQLLDSNPNLDKKPIVERMIAEARQQGNVQ
ncbi:MAG TPA: tetratricopeptide repeat protein [Terriglobales bacterium]|nr:tetratricopeptide repeat protein [Terriglobales bacterium]